MRSELQRSRREAMTHTAVVFTCEHASHFVPAWCRRWVPYSQRWLRSHRGYDLGAADLATWLAARLGAPCVLGDVSRLAIDLNRSAHHRALFGGALRSAPQSIRQRLLAEHYRPYRAGARAIMQAALRSAVVLHVAVHSFTPVLKGVRRNADVGLLFDPSRTLEAEFAHRLQSEIKARSQLHVRRNYPYLGTADGHTTELRQTLGGAYCGLELEVNQRLLLGRCVQVYEIVADAIQAVSESET